MASLRMLTRRMRRALTSKAVTLCSISVLLFLGIQWVILHNHDQTSAASSIVPRPTARVDSKHIDWARFKYVQLVTTEQNLCSALMVWNNIETIGSRAQRLMLYPSNWDLEETIDGELTPIARMIKQAQKSYFVKIRPLDALVQNITGENIWAEPYTKFLGFSITDFERVLVIDPDSVVKQNLDELFLIPQAPVAMPYVYLGKQEGWQFSTQVMLITPSANSFTQISDAIRGAQSTAYDTTILETLFHGQIIKIPQRPFALLSGEYRRTSHRQYMGLRFPKKWDPDYIQQEARIMHFSDYPLPKPWARASQELLNKNMPQCQRSEWFGASNCRDREVWMKMYSDYREGRKAVCGAQFEAVLKEGPEEEAGRGRTRVLRID